MVAAKAALAFVLAVRARIVRQRTITAVSTRYGRIPNLSLSLELNQAIRPTLPTFRLMLPRTSLVPLGLSKIFLRILLVHLENFPRRTTTTTTATTMNIQVRHQVLVEDQAERRCVDVHVQVKTSGRRA